MKNVTKTLMVEVLADDVLAELGSAIEEFVCDSLSDENPTSLKEQFGDYLDKLQDQIQSDVDSFMEEDLELDFGSYLDQPMDNTSVSAYYDMSSQSFHVTVDTEMEDRDEAVKETDFSRLIGVLNDLGLNMTDKTAILKIASDAGVK